MVVPFPYELIPQVSREELSFSKDLECAFGEFFNSTAMSGSLEQLLSKLLGGPVSLGQVVWEIRKNEEVISGILPHSMVGRLQMIPGSRVVLLEVDQFLAEFASDLLLGGDGESSMSHKIPGEVEKGVLSYLIVRVLENIFTRSSQASKMHFRLHDLTDAATMLPLLKKEGVYFQFHIPVRVRERNSFARLFIPHSLLMDLRSLYSGKKETGKTEVDRMQQFEYIHTELRAEIGSLKLTVQELESLEPGDVLLFGESFVGKSPETLSGRVFLNVGMGNSQKVFAKILSVEDQKINLEIEI